MIEIYRSVCRLSLVGLVLFSSAVNGVAQQKEKVAGKSRQLKVSANKHYLVKDDGTPFFYLGDTAWELFHRLNREEADRYLEDRRRKGFTVIQAVALAELNGHKDPNAYGHLPLTDLDPGRPAVKPGEANDYWDHVDYIVNKANNLGLYIGFLPTWGKYWHGNPEALFTTENAEAYGEWLGKRYRNKDIICIPGDQIVVTDRVPTSVPGVGRYKFVATRDSDGTYAMVYAPVGREFKVHMDVIKGEKVKAWWYNPRNGEATEIGIFDNKGERSFTPPQKGEAIDWVLVLDDVSKKYSAPGS
jgi:hypothetical protein